MPQRPSPSVDRRSRPTGEAGQVLVLMVVALVSLLGVAALVIDIGHAYLAQRTLQSAADASALAGAQGLPNEGTATALARSYSGENGRKNARSNVQGVTSEIRTFCRPGPGAACTPSNAVEVSQTADVETQFARIFGVDSVEVSARAVSMIRAGNTPWAIFAYDSGCGSLVLKVNGDGTVVDGAIRSNGKIEVDGSPFTSGYTSAGDCPHDIEPGSDLGGGSEQPVIEPDLQPWPRYYEEHEFTCDFQAAKFNFNQAGQTIPTGTYCATELFEANANNQSGTITVLAPEIKIDGDNQFFRPHQLDVLFFVTGDSDKELILNGNEYDWEGVIFHPTGRIKLNGGSSHVLHGLIEGLQVEINGESFHMVGTGPDSGENVIELVE